MKIRLPIGLILTIMVLAGCASSISATKFYLITPLKMEAATELRQQPVLSIEIASIQLPQYLDRPQIVSRSSSNRMELAEFHQWGGNLGKNMMRVLSRNLELLLHTPNITPTPRIPAIPPHFRIDIEIMKFERGADNKVNLELRWYLVNLSGDESTKSFSKTYRSNRIQNTNDFNQTVAAMSQLFAQLSQNIAEEILSQHDQH